MSTELSKARRHELRLSFYDFAVRGEGDRGHVSSVIEQWRSAGCLSNEEANRWQDALAWRDFGGLLPGWPLPAAQKEKRGEPDESDLRAFEAWRAGLREASAA